MPFKVTWSLLHKCLSKLHGHYYINAIQIWTEYYTKIALLFSVVLMLKLPGTLKGDSGGFACQCECDQLDWIALPRIHFPVCLMVEWATERHSMWDFEGPVKRSSRPYAQKVEATGTARLLHSFAYLLVHLVGEKQPSPQLPRLCLDLLVSLGGVGV